jgi:hypothetical protein
MLPNGYAIVLDYSGQFQLRYYQDVNITSSWIIVSMSYNYDDIMRALLSHREYNCGMGKEYWIS